ncbi:MAG: hypothetical protein R3D03_03255 [Geminicoccaceae bacterium]
MLSKISLKRASAALCCLAATACTNPYATGGNYASPIGGALVWRTPRSTPPRSPACPWRWR